MFLLCSRFSLSSAHYVFTKVVKPLEKHWRIQGLRIAVFLDDDEAIVQNRESCRIKARTVRADFCNAGFVVKRQIGMGAHASIGLAGYNLEFCVRHFENCGKKNC